MSLFDKDDPEPINVLEYLRDAGLGDKEAFGLIMQLVLTSSFAFEADIRAVALEVGIEIPPRFIVKDSGRTH